MDLGSCGTVRDVFGCRCVGTQQITALAQAGERMTAGAIDRLKMVATQELSQLARIDSITLTTVFQQGILARITH